MALHLYELTDQFKQLLEMMENPDIDPEAIADTMEGVQGELEGKVDGTICVIKSLEASAKAIKEEEARLSARRKAMENNATGLKRYLEQQMKTLEVEKIQTMRFTASLQNNPSSVVVADEEAFNAYDPDKRQEWWSKPEPKLSLSVLKEYIQHGVTVPGVEIRQEKGLRIR